MSLLSLRESDNWMVSALSVSFCVSHFSVLRCDYVYAWLLAGKREGGLRAIQDQADMSTFPASTGPLTVGSQ